MADPFTIASVGSLVISEGVKFLYNQATEFLKRIHAQKSPSPVPSDKSESIKIEIPDTIFESIANQQLEVNVNVLSTVGDELRDIRKSLDEYANGILAIDTNDEVLLHSVDAMRQILELTTQRQLNFKGEQRESSELIVEGHVEVDLLEGKATGLRARLIKQGIVKGTVKANTVKEGSVTGVSVNKIG